MGTGHVQDEPVSDRLSSLRELPKEDRKTEDQEYRECGNVGDTVERTIIEQKMGQEKGSS